jgi:type IV pilus assembly protein PilB
MFKKSLGDILMDAEFITHEQLQEALKVQSKTRKSLGKVLNEKGILTPRQITEALEFQLGIPYIDIQSTKIDPKALSLIPEHLARLHGAIPIQLKGDILKVAFCDPLNSAAIEAIRLSSGKKVEPVVSTEADIFESINNYYSHHDSLDKTVRDLREVEAVLSADETDAFTDISADSEIVRLADSLIEQAISDKASDIHVEPQDINVIVRYRIDGLLREVMRYPINRHPAMVTRIKILSGMDITQKRLPQDGRMKFLFKGRDIDLRVSTLPVVFGEKIAIRILDRGKFFLEINELGFEQDAVKELRSIINSPHGMILATGPTGSGKTTTLYSVIKDINSATQNIVTLEDPVEYLIDGVNQMQINPKAGLGFATGLRSILRQDPNVIMVGEIRDPETAKISIQAALTGHLVFSTLHTNDAAGALTRLIDMGVEPFLVASSVIGIIAQRLVRKICRHCAQAYDALPHEKSFLGLTTDTEINIYRGIGCSHCNHTGYSGRTIIYEILKVSPIHQELIMKKAPSEAIKLASKRLGMKTLLDTGKNKILSGITTIDEMLKATYTIG